MEKAQFTCNTIMLHHLRPKREYCKCNIEGGILYDASGWYQLLTLLIIFYTRQQKPLSKQTRNSSNKETHTFCVEFPLNHTHPDTPRPQSHLFPHNHSQSKRRQTLGVGHTIPIVQYQELIPNIGIDINNRINAGKWLAMAAWFWMTSSVVQPTPQAVPRMSTLLLPYVIL